MYEDFETLDSKTLTEESREALFETINGHPDLFGWKAEILSPNDISNSMLQRCVSLLM